MDAYAVLVAPEARRWPRGARKAEHRHRRRRTLAGGGVPVLGASPATERRVVRRGDVAGRVHAWDSGPAGGVDAEPAGVESGAGDEAELRLRADCDQHVVALDTAAAAQQELLDTAVAARGA